MIVGQITTQRRWSRHWRRGEVRNPLAYVGLAIISVVLVGGLLLMYLLQGEELDDRYGEASGRSGQASVNGVGILAGLFREAGHRVTSWPKLSPTLALRADTIVWFPSDVQKPPDEVTAWLDNWLFEKSGRTLIFVGRDFDAEPGYWQHVSPGAPQEVASEFALQQAKAAGDFTIVRQAIPAQEDWWWFTVQGTSKHRQVTTLEGAPGWLTGVDPTQLGIELHGRLIPPSDDRSEDIDILLESEGDPLVWREEYLKLNEDFRSQLIVVANGSFLLNLPLVNHEHRKLAAALVREIGPSQHVVFLESDGSPEVSEEDPQPTPPSATKLLGIEPFDRILLHLALVGIIFCFARWPIFGRPRAEPEAPLSDFGEHVSSLGELLATAGNRELAWERITQYHQIQRPEARVHKPPEYPATPPGKA